MSVFLVTVRIIVIY